MKKILDVPYRKQQLANSCFPACVRMVLWYYGDNIDEKGLYRKSRLPGHPAGWDVQIGPILIRKGYDVASYWNGTLEDHWEITPATLKAHREAKRKARKTGMHYLKNATVSLIKQCIDQKIPVLTEVNADVFYGKKYGHTHMIVTLGYDSNYFYVHDPDKNLGGKYRKIPLSRFRKAWERLSPKSGRSMIVIKRKKNK